MTSPLSSVSETPKDRHTAHAQNSTVLLDLLPNGAVNKLLRLAKFRPCSTHVLNTLHSVRVKITALDTIVTTSVLR
jgi:hypothetical protein